MSEKKAGTKKTTKPPKTKPAAAPKAKRERKPKEENLCVFALRLTPAERDALHAAAGPANATRVMRALAGAFVKEDRAVFEAIVEDAKKLRA